jgi:ATP-dependent metalloprotease
MVTSLGMSAKLGNMEYESRYNYVSSETKALIESEVQKILADSYERCRKVLTEHRKELDLLAKALVDYETLSRDEVEKVIRGEALPDRKPLPRGPMVVPVPDDPTVDPADKTAPPGSPPPPPPPPGPGGLA